MFKLPKALMCQLARVVVPEYAKLLRDLQKGGGRFQFEKHLAAYLERIGAYVRLYEDERKLITFYAIGLLGDEEVKDIDSELQQLSEQEAQEYSEALLSEIVKGEISEIEWPESDEEWEKERCKAEERFRLLTKDEQTAATVQGARVVGGLIATFLNTVSLMVHGAKLTTLVPAAIAGDETAFLKAVQIDRHILRHFPYFIERKRLAQELGEKDFLRKLAYSESKPPLKGKIRFPALYMLFGFLEAGKSLDDFSHTELLDLCDEMGLDRFQNRIEDVGYLTKRLIGYREWQKTGGVSMH